MNPEHRNRWRDELIGAYNPVATRLLGAYERFLPLLRDLTEDLVDAIAEKNTDGETVSEQDVRDLTEYSILIRRVTEEMTAFSGVLRNEASQLADDAVQMASQTTLDQVLALNGTAQNAQIIASAWNQPNPEALQNLIGYVDSDVMRDKFNVFGDNAGQSIADIVLGMVGQGKNSRVIARTLDKWMQVPYRWAENMARTVQVYSYREASRLSYERNSNIVEGWVWGATLDARTCMSCVVQHGQFYPVSQSLNDHHLGRCTMLPSVYGATWRLNFQTGIEWFKSLPSEQQRTQMGNNRLFDGWQNNEFQLSDLSVEYENDVYGTMRRQASYRELRGEM